MADTRGRRPDGVPTDGAAEQPLVGEAANKAQDKVEVRPLRGFPSGLKAIEELDPDEQVTLINLQLGRLFPTLVDWAKPERRGGGRPAKQIAVGPFQAFTARQQDAVRLLKLWGPECEADGKKVKLVVAPPKGDCGGKLSFHVPPLRNGEGLDIPTCPYADCPHHKQDPKLWSIWQAQSFIMRTKSPSAIEDFINVWDSRRDVLFFGTQMAGLRRQRKLERMGVGAGASGRVY